MSDGIKETHVTDRRSIHVIVILAPRTSLTPYGESGSATREDSSDGVLVDLLELPSISDFSLIDALSPAPRLCSLACRKL